MTRLKTTGANPATHETPLVDGDAATPAAEQTPPAAIEQPREGGSYVRQSDGSLAKRED